VDAMLFQEEQKFNQRWLWMLLVTMTLATVFLFGKGMIQQLILGEPWGDRPMSDLALLIVGTGMIVFVVGMTYLFYSLRLITQVKLDGLYVQFYPLKRRRIAFDEIKSCKARIYHPIKEYGGWGIKYGKKGKAYNVFGDKGVQLEFFQGKPLLIGSQRAEELAGAINRYLSK
jgi:hypothetical protein